MENKNDETPGLAKSFTKIAIPIIMYILAITQSSVKWMQ